MSEVSYEMPKMVRAGFEIIATLKKDQITQLTSIIKELPRGVNRKAFFTAIESKFQIKDSEYLANALFSLGSLLFQTKDTFEDLAENISLSYNETRKDKLSDKQVEQLKFNLIELFKCCSNIKVTFKAIDLLIENFKTFLDSHVVTDIRMVFGDNLDDDKRNAVIIHNLKIEYKQENKTREVYVALDNSDLINLREQLDRAINKEKVIRINYQSNFEFLTLND